MANQCQIQKEPPWELGKKVYNINGTGHMTKMATMPIYGKNFHYVNMPMQYTAIFHGCKNDNFQMKNFDIFFLFAQNIDCGYTLEPPQ